MAKKGFNVEELIKNKVICRGTVIRIQYDEEDMKNDRLEIDCGGVLCYMPRTEIDVIFERSGLAQFVGHVKKFRFISVEEDGTIIVSRKNILEELRDKVIAELEAGKEIKAKIVKIKYDSAYLTYKDTVMIMRNRDFSTISDRTPIQEVLREGQIVKVKLAEITGSKRIHVQMVEKYESPVKVPLNTFTRGQVVLGLVVGVQPFGCFVRVAPGHDALCPIPTFNGEITYEPVLGDRVRVRIMQANHDGERSKIRAKIMDKVEEQTEEDLLTLDADTSEEE